MSTAKRIYFYLVYLITLGIFAAGVTILLTVVFDAVVGQSEVLTGGTFSRQLLSLGLAMMVIGGGLWLLFRRAIRRSVTADPAEVGSTVRKLFWNLILTVSALMGLSAGGEFLRWLMAGAGLSVFPTDVLTQLIVAAAIWYYHWRLSEGEGHPSPEALTLRRWYVYILSGWGLVVLSVSTVQLVNLAVLQLPFWEEAIVTGPFWGDAAQGSIAWLSVSGLAWVFHWFGMARGDYDSDLRQVYLYLLAIVGGAVAGLVTLTTAFYQTTYFVLGGVGTTGAAYFKFLGWTVPLMVVAGAVWVYHQRVTQEEAVQVPQRRLSARRIHLYIMSFLGLATTIAGLIVLLGVLLDWLIGALGSQSILVTAGWWRLPVSLSLALLLVAVPIWLYYWNRVLAVVGAGGAVERGARSRRIFVYVFLGIAVVALAADLVNILYQMLNGLLQGNFGVAVLQESKWSLQTVVVAVPLFLYFWQVLRQDQRLGMEVETRKAVSILVGEPAAALVRRVEEKLGYKIRTLYLTGESAGGVPPVLSEEEVGRLVADIRTAPSERVIILATGGQIRLLPYREK